MNSFDKAINQPIPKVWTSEIYRGIKAAVPVLLGFIPFGLVLGAQAAQKGLSALELPLMTALNFGGGSEFAAVELWTSPPHMFLIALMTLLINSRHILMGAALAPYVSHLPKRSILPALFFMCDESWAITMEDITKRERQTNLANHAFSLPFYAGVAGTLYLTWIISTATGVQIGPSLGDIRTLGFDMAFPAVFFVLLRGMWPGIKAAYPWLVSLVVAVTVYLLIPGAWYVPVGSLAGVLAAYFLAEEKAS